MLCLIENVVRIFHAKTQKRNFINSKSVIAKSKTCKCTRIVCQNDSRVMSREYRSVVNRGLPDMGNII